MPAGGLTDGAETCSPKKDGPRRSREGRWPPTSRNLDCPYDIPRRPYCRVRGETIDVVTAGLGSFHQRPERPGRYQRSVTAMPTSWHARRIAE